MIGYKEAYKNKLKKENEETVKKMKAQIGNKKTEFIYEIEDGIPYNPQRSHERTKLELELLLEIKIGQSFFVPCDNNKKEINSLRSKFSALSRKLNIKLGSTFLEDKKGFGVRFWRLG